MKVYGHDITPDLMRAAFDAVPNQFGHYQLRRVLENRGVPGERYTSCEAANRLLQKWRKQGLVVYVHRGMAWHKTKLA